MYHLLEVVKTLHLGHSITSHSKENNSPFFFTQTDADFTFMLTSTFKAPTYTEQKYIFFVCLKF